MAIGNIYGGAPKFHNVATTAQHGQSCPELGDLCFIRDSVFRYVRAAGTITAGQVCIATVSEHTITNITGFKNTGDINTQHPYIEDTAETMTPGAYDGGYLHLGTGTGVGQTKRIDRNTATRIYFKAMHPEFGETDPFTTDPDTTTDIVVICPWYVNPCGASDKIQTVVGVAPAAITDTYYGWVQCGGLAVTKCGGSGVVDTLVVPGDDTAGQGTVAATTDDLGDGTPFGVALFAGADDTTWPVLLRGLY